MPGQRQGEGPPLLPPPRPKGVGRPQGGQEQDPGVLVSNRPGFQEGSASPRDPTADCGALGVLGAHGQPAQHSPPLPGETHHSHRLGPPPKADPFREDPQSPPAVPPGARQAGCHEAGSRGTPRTSGGGGICSGPGPGPPHFLRGRCQFRQRAGHQAGSQCHLPRPLTGCHRGRAGSARQGWWSWRSAR